MIGMYSLGNANDTLFTVEADVSNVQIQEISISKNSNWVGKSIAECKIPKEQIIILIRRGEENIIPSGSTVIMANDVLLTCSLKS